MSLINRNGDKGTTELVRTKNVSKSDDRIHLLGTIEELSSHLGLLKSMTKDASLAGVLEQIQRRLLIVAAGVSDPYSKDGKLGEEAAEELEIQIRTMEEQFDYPLTEVLPGGSPFSAQTDLARSVARRAERALASVSVKFGSDNGAKKYLNRLGDYLYTLARYEEAAADESDKKITETKAAGSAPSRIQTAESEQKQETEHSEEISEKIVREVLRQMGIQGRISLEAAKKLIEEIEKEAQRRGKKAVIAVCGPEGNPIAVHVMDGAFLVSFDVAVKKAYTSVAVKMSTMELNALAQPGGTFYGLDKMEGGNIIIFGGGIPLKVGDTIIGGLGVSGGTGEEDHSLAEYGLSVLPSLL